MTDDNVVHLADAAGGVLLGLATTPYRVRGLRELGYITEAQAAELLAGLAEQPEPEPSPEGGGNVVPFRRRSVRPAVRVRSDREVA